MRIDRPSIILKLALDRNIVRPISSSPFRAVIVSASPGLGDRSSAH